MSGDMKGSGEPKALRIVIAGGGTGGHVFPGLAIAQEFMDRNKHNRIVFISTGNRSISNTVSRPGSTP